MDKFPVDVPKRKVIKTLQILGFRIVREKEHISMLRENPDGSKIGVVLFKYGKEDVFQKFVEDVMSNVKFLSLPLELYGDVVSARKSLNLDFDDAYQYTLAKYHGLKIVTMDKDVDRI